MTWTNERVDTLRILWKNGESASAIANTLGENLTRNAVIGKVHRLKLAGRATTTRSRSPRPLFLFPAKAQIHKARGTRRKARHCPPRANPETKRPSILPEIAPPPDNAVTVQTLTPETCRWPVGDPKTPSFHFCGRFSVADRPYCNHHAAIAYSPSR